MPLAGYQPETREIEVGATSFHVKGLAVTEIAVLMREHFPDLDAVADLFTHGIDKLDAQQFQGIALTLITQAPGLVANVIALAAGEGDASDAVKLPVPVQVKALYEIGDLTFRDVGGPKKCWEIVAALLRKSEMSQKVLAKMTGKTA
jgi:hypothetical protein